MRVLFCPSGVGLGHVGRCIPIARRLERDGAQVLFSTYREGIRYVKEEIGFLSVNGKRKWVPYALVDTTVRFLGYRIGLLEKSLPVSLKKRISFNKGFWENDSLSA